MRASLVAAARRTHGFPDSAGAVHVLAMMDLQQRATADTQGVASPEPGIIRRMQVPGWPHLYVLGCFENRVTFYNQQVRALNLIHAIRNLPLPRPAKIAVIGAGAGGLTAAAAAAIWDRRSGRSRDWEVMVLDDRPDLLALIGHGSARWLHPHIYDWPAKGSTESGAGLCIMDWETGTAGTVIDGLRPHWERIAREYGIDCNLGISDLQIERLEGSGRYALRWYHDPQHGQPFDVVILAVGFGTEEKSNNFAQRTSYWAADNLERDETARPGFRKKVLVSGTGDGGLIDILRLSFRRFRHDMVLQQLEEWLDRGGLLEWVKSEIKRIEHDAENLKPVPDSQYETILHDEYQELARRIEGKAG